MIESNFLEKKTPVKVLGDWKKLILILLLYKIGCF